MAARKNYKYYDLVMASFVTILLCSNLIGAPKIAQIGSFKFGAGVLFFPLSYIFGDILTEVYGYAASRKVVWAGFAAMAFASFMSYVVLALTPADGWPHQAAYETVFGATPRLVIASLLAFCAGEFTNSFVLAKMKVRTDGKGMGIRFIVSTVAGEAIDSAIFYPLAFLGIWSSELVLTVLLSNYCLKVAWEFVMLPITFKITNFLKKAENEDYFDRNTNFNPFTLES